MHIVSGFTAIALLLVIVFSFQSAAFASSPLWSGIEQEKLDKFAQTAVIWLSIALVLKHAVSMHYFGKFEGKSLAIQTFKCSVFTFLMGFVYYFFAQQMVAYNQFFANLVWLYLLFMPIVITSLSEIIVLSLMKMFSTKTVIKACASNFCFFVIACVVICFMASSLHLVSIPVKGI